jgi:hypothetical protein
LRELVALSQEKDLGPAGIAALLKRLFGKEVGETQKAVSTAVKALTGDEIGKLLAAIRTGEVPEDAAAEVATGSPTEDIPPPVDDFLAEPAKPRRGRPPGSKNKPKVVEEFEADS